MGTIYKVGGLVIDNYTPKNGKTYELSELQAIVSGYIEVIPINDGKQYMVMNEEGKIKGLGINHEATKILQKNFPHTNDIVVGDVLVCDESELD